MPSNEYGDLPMPQRAEDIVNIARERLASSGGKASQLPAMIQRVTEEFRMKDTAQSQGRNHHAGMTMPNNIDHYIDQVLGMSGMTGGDNNGLPTNGPIPSDRPLDGSPVGPDAGPSTDIGAEGAAVVEQAEAEGWPFGKLAAALAGVGGLYAAGRFLYNRYGTGKSSPTADAVDVASGRANNPVDQTIADIDGNSRAVTQYDPGASPEQEEQTRSVTEEKRARLEGPRDAIESPRAGLPAPTSPVDETIAAVDGEQPTPLSDQQFQDRVEGRDLSARPGPNRFGSTDGGVDNRAAIIDQASKLPAREATQLLRENGIEIDDDVMRMLAEGSNSVKSLRSRASDIAAGAVRRAVR